MKNFYVGQKMWLLCDRRSEPTRSLGLFSLQLGLPYEKVLTLRICLYAWPKQVLFIEAPRGLTWNSSPFLSESSKRSWRGHSRSKYRLSQTNTSQQLSTKSCVNEITTLKTTLYLVSPARKIAKQDKNFTSNHILLILDQLPTLAQSRIPLLFNEFKTPVFWLSTIKTRFSILVWSRSEMTRFTLSALGRVMKTIRLTSMKERRW